MFLITKWSSQPETVVELMLLTRRAFCSKVRTSWVEVPSDSNREIKIYVYGIRQTANVSWEFLRMENKQIKTVRTILVDKTGIKLVIFV